MHSECRDTARAIAYSGFYEREREIYRETYGQRQGERGRGRETEGERERQRER